MAAAYDFLSLSIQDLNVLNFKIPSSDEIDVKSPNQTPSSSKNILLNLFPGFRVRELALLKKLFYRDRALNRQIIASFAIL